MYTYNKYYYLYFMIVNRLRINFCIALCRARLFGDTSWMSTLMGWVDRKEWTTWRGRRESMTSWRENGHHGSALRTLNLYGGMFWKTSWGRTGLIHTIQAQKTVLIWLPSQICSPHLPSHIHRCVEMSSHFGLVFSCRCSVYRILVCCVLLNPLMQRCVWGT